MRFPVVLFVVILHAYTATRSLINGTGSELYHICTYYPSLILGNMGVPTFFTISGYLFFNKFNFSDLSSYRNKLKTRIKTLLIPYLSWNLFMLLLLLLLQNLPWTDAYFSGNNKPVIEYNFKDFLYSFWNIGTGFPILSTFWYIRNLMVLCICSPIIYLLCKKLKFIYLLVVGGLWFFTPTLAFTYTSLFYFSLGGYLIINNIDIISLIKRYNRSIITLFIIFSVGELFIHFYWNNEFSIYIQKALLLQGPIFFFTVSLYLIEKGMQIPQFLSQTVFFIYALHYPIILGISKILLKVLNDGEYKFLLGYFLSIFLTIAICLFTHKILQKVSPNLLMLISGNRS